MTKPQYIAVNSLRYIPIYGALASVINVFLVIVGIDIPFIEIAVTSAGFYIAVIFSRVLHFCLIHRLCVYYAFIMFVFTWLRRYTGGYGLLTPFTTHIRLILLIVGVIIVCLVVRRYIKSKQK